MKFSIQSILEDEKVLLLPLEETDFDNLYEVASDKKIWEQHPCKDRWKREVFKIFFDEAIQSKGAFKIIDKSTGEIAGSSRFYNYDETDHSIVIGFTFFAVKYWGKGMNPSVKKLMMDYIFQYVDKIYFYVGAYNFRSQIAVTSLGAKKIKGEENSDSENPKENFVYKIHKNQYKNMD